MSQLTKNCFSQIINLISPHLTLLPPPPNISMRQTPNTVLKHKAVYLLLPTSQSINQSNLWIGHSNSIAYTIADYRLLSETLIRHLSPNELGSVVPSTIIFTSAHIDMLTKKSGGESKCNRLHTISISDGEE